MFLLPQAILNFAVPLDVSLLDQVAQVFLSGSGAQVSIHKFTLKYKQFLKPFPFLNLRLHSKLKLRLF